METTFELLAAHPFLTGMTTDLLAELAPCTRRRSLPTGTTIFREGEQADRFWLVREGVIAIEFHVPGRGDIVVESIGGGTALGWSWIQPPHRWRFTAIAAEPTLALELDAVEVRRRCEANPALGHDLTRRFAAVLADRLSAARTRLVDLYAYPHEVTS